MDKKYCRFCGKELTHCFADLGLSPLSNEYLTKEHRKHGQHFYPLIAHVCNACFLVQISQYEKPEQIFNDYRYFSSYSQSWLLHCKRYVDQIVDRLSLSCKSKVLEIACNDGYLLQYFQDYDIPALGIEPAENVAKVAIDKGIDVIVGFFGRTKAQKIVKEQGQFDLVIGNNVLAHVPDLNDFVEGIYHALKPLGTVTLEFPHLLQLMKNKQFDTIYHEHFSYFSLLSVKEIFLKHHLIIYDVEELETHGGSIRIYATHKDNKQRTVQPSIERILQHEKQDKLDQIATYRAFHFEIQKLKRNALKILIQLKNEGKKIAAFGAAAKGNTFLNYCGIGSDFIEYVVDSNPHKQGLFLPGSLIPIVDLQVLKDDKPDYIVILPWNLKDEIVQVLNFTREWGCKFISCIPETKIF